MSHELRTPLNAIIGYSEAMLGGMAGEFTKQQNTLLGHVQHNSRRLLGLINDVLDLSKIESGSVELRIAPMSPHRLIHETVDSLRSLAQDKDIYLRVEIDDKLAEFIQADSDKIQQILVNLISNAVKFTDEGGVTVRVSAPDDHSWQLRVEDTGIGMPPDAADYIFDPFQQVDGSSTRKYRGTGLGLAIVKRLIEQMGGSIEVETELGQGSAFNIILPTVIIVSAEPLRQSS
jgi:signal transduction histidine kinase